MIVAFAFWLFLLGAISIGWQIGDASDRKAMIAILGAALATLISGFFFEGIDRNIVVRVIDILLFVVMVRFALTSRRLWPVWFSGIQGTATIIGIAALVIPDPRAPALLLISAAWAIPALVAMVAGLLIDRRRGALKDPHPTRTN